MAQQVTLQKQVYDKNQYQRVIDTSFTQLVQPVVVTDVAVLPTVDEFFSDYDQLFFDIPKFGETNSHEYLIQTSQEYIGLSNVVNDEIQALINEITELRQENLELQQQLLSVITPSTNG